MEPAAFAHWRRWQVPLRRAAIFRLSAIACWLPLADNRKHHTRASPDLKLRPGASIYRLLHCTSLLVAQSEHFAAEFQCPLLGLKRTLIGRAPMSTSDQKDRSGVGLYLHQFARFSWRSGGDDQITPSGHVVALGRLPDWSDRIDDSRASWIGYESR